MHISSQNGSNSVDEHLEKIREEHHTLQTISAELFFELEDYWVDSVRLNSTSPTTKLLNALQRCPRLSSLHVYSPRATSPETIPLLIKSFTPKLTSLSITRSVRFENAEDVDSFAKAIRKCQNLVDFKLVHPHCSERLPIDEIIRALADLPTLQSVDVTLFTASTCKTTFVSPKTLHALLRSPNLGSLSLWGCGIQDYHLEVLQQSNKLNFLSLRRNPQIADWKPFYQSLETNVNLKALYNDHADLMSCMHPTLPNHSPDSAETAAVVAAEVCLALNRLGRGEEECDEDFYDMIEAVNESYTALYYLLRCRPDIWCDRPRRDVPEILK